RDPSSYADPIAAANSHAYAAPDCFAYGHVSAVGDLGGHARTGGRSGVGQLACGAAANGRAPVAVRRLAGGREWGVRGISGGSGRPCGRRGAAEAQTLTAP